jgi:polyhydroxybutyrate depolymerase
MKAVRFWCLLGALAASSCNKNHKVEALDTSVDAGAGGVSGAGLSAASGRGGRDGSANGGQSTASGSAGSGMAGAPRGTAGAHSSSAGESGADGTGGASSGTGGSSSEGGSAGSGGSGSSLSSGCGLTGKATGDLQLKVRDGANVMRDLAVLVPGSYKPNTPLALTFVFHGAGGTSADAKAFGMQDATGASAASIFVFPQGVQFQSYGIGWDDGCSGYDMPFFDNMLATIGASYCIDLNRVFAGGFSWGCDQVVALACCRSDKVRAIAAASCTDEYSDPADYKTYQSCPARSKVSAIRFTHDTLGDSGYPAPLFATTLSLFRAWNGCSTTSTATTPSPCQAYSGCGAPLVDCPYDNLQHALPGGWGSDSWKFFSSLP